MSWVGNWVGKYLGNWLGSTSSSSGVTVNAIASVLVLFTPTVVVNLGSLATASPSEIQLTTPTVVVNLGSLATASPSEIQLTTPTVVVNFGFVVPVNAVGIVFSPVSPSVLNAAVAAVNVVNISLTVPTAVVNVAAFTEAAPSLLVLYQPQHNAYGSSLHIADVADVALYVLQAQVVLKTTVNATLSYLTLAIQQPNVYDQYGSITYIEAYDMKMYPPELFAFSTDITTDMQVVDAIGDDMTSIDGTQQVKLLRRTDNVVINLSLGEAVPENKIYTFEHALIRQISDRDNRAVKQLRLFMQSVQNDDFGTMDTIIELPMRDDVQILSGDIIQADVIGTKYTVVAVDHCTLKTRWRVGARKFI